MIARVVRRLRHQPAGHAGHPAEGIRAAQPDRRHAATYDAAWGWHCPDTGPGGTANCDPAYAGLLQPGLRHGQAVVPLPGRPAASTTTRPGETVDILWNVVESGCGAAPVTIPNPATASLYNYTPYQPNAAALAAYPGAGDACCAYGNRNFFFLFRKYFGSTGGGDVVDAKGRRRHHPGQPSRSRRPRRSRSHRPNPKVAKGLAAGLVDLGTPYVWGRTGGGAAEQRLLPRRRDQQLLRAPSVSTAPA